MRSLLIPLVFCCTLVSLAGKSSISDLESRLKAIDKELGELAHLSLRGGVGSIGHRSISFPNPKQSVWVEIDFGEIHKIDQVVLVPVLWRDAGKGFHDDGFPAEFQVVVGQAGDREGQVVAEYKRVEGHKPRIAPVVVPLPGIEASWVRIECTRLSPRVHDGRHVFQLSEILVFSDNQNVVLRQPVEASFEGPTVQAGAWDKRFLVDGVIPYLMDSGEGDPSLAYISEVGEVASLFLDLGEPRAFSEIHLHAVDQSDTVPQVFPGDLGIPKEIRVEGANSPDFSDAKVLLNHRGENIYDTGPIMMWDIAEQESRYVRLIVVEPGIAFDTLEGGARIGFSEIALISKGINVALGKAARVEGGGLARRPPAALTDGRNAYGKILPIKQWLNELSLRHELEMERVDVEAELNSRYLRQKWLLRVMTWVALFLLVVIGSAIVVHRLLSIRHEAQVRKRIAANLHDELGANLHAIGMLGDIAEESIHQSGRLIETVRRIRSLTERTGAAAHYCTNMMEAHGFCENPVDDMKRDAERLLADLDYDIKIEGEDALNRLKRRTRIDLFLFYKESLVNVVRHAQASRCEVCLSVDDKALELVVSDNGCGVREGTPSSLQRRARFMRAIVSVETPSEGGTVILLKMKLRRFLIFKK